MYISEPVYYMEDGRPKVKFWTRENGRTDTCILTGGELDYLNAVKLLRLDYEKRHDHDSRESGESTSIPCPY